MSFFWIGLGGALGAISRYVVATAIFKWMDKPFPYGTLSVNLGSLSVRVGTFKHEKLHHPNTTPEPSPSEL